MALKTPKALTTQLEAGIPEPGKPCAPAMSTLNALPLEPANCLLVGANAPHLGSIGVPARLDKCYNCCIECRGGGG